jgi:hypothetical protein
MRWLCAISHHGLGHLAQTAPVLNALARMRPDLEWLIWSGLPRQTLEQRLRIRFDHRHEGADPGLLMRDALRVDRQGSLHAYRRFHAQWPARVAREADWLGGEHVTAVLSNVAYLPLAAAAKAGIPSLGFCSLNWLDIAHHYLADAQELTQAFADMRAAYLHARAFLRLTPGLPMAWLHHLEPAPPVASLGRCRRREIDDGLKLKPDTKLVMLGFGGVSYASATPLPPLPQVVWLVPDTWMSRPREDMRFFGEAGLPFPDLLASCDALVTKVGYGSFVEAAGLGLPVLYLDRPDWPETPWLTAWLRLHTRARAIDEPTLFSPALGGVLESVWASPHTAPADIGGAPAIARRVIQLLAP